MTVMGRVSKCKKTKLKMDKIIIKNASYLCNIGVSEEERREKQQIFVDVVMHYDTKKSAESGEIDHTINYSGVNKWIKELVQGECKLIEQLAEKIAETILLIFNANKVEISIKKPNAIRNADYAAVEVIRENDRLSKR